MFGMGGWCVNRLKLSCHLHQGLREEGHAGMRAHFPSALQGFIRQASRDIVIQSDNPAELIAKLEAYAPPPSIIKLALEGRLLHNLRG